MFQIVRERKHKVSIYIIQTMAEYGLNDMMGHIVEWYYNGIAGIKPKNVVYQVDDSFLKRRKDQVEWIFYEK